MRILVLSSFYYPEKGAASYRISNMCNELYKRGHDVEVITTMANYPKGVFFKGYKYKFFKRETIDNIRVFRYCFIPTNSNSSLIRFISLISSSIMSLFTTINFLLISKKFDIAIIQTPPLTSAFSYSLVCKLFSLKYILNVSDIWPSTAVDLGAIKSNSLTFEVLNKIESTIYKLSYAFLCQSYETYNYLKQKSGKKLLIYRNLSKSYNNNLPVTNNKIRIIYAGLLGNAQDILSICKNIDWEKLKIEFHIYGDGLQKTEIQRIKNHYIKIHDTVSKKEIHDKMKSYDFSLVPLRVNIFGAFPSKITSGISSGVPILYIGEGEGFTTVKKFKIGESFRSNDFSKVFNFLNHYSNNKQIYINKYKKGIKFALANDFNYKNNNDSLDRFLNSLVN